MSLSRREFLGQTGAAGAGFWIAQSSTFLRAQTPNERLDITMIAAGGRGAANLRSVKSENIVGLVDPDGQRLGKAGEKYPDAKQFNDYRKLYQSGLKYDAVVVSTPEHHHALATLPALRMKKHVYCEKPLTHTVYEARVIATEAIKAGVATQMGTQIHATENYRRVVELVQSGAVGKITECHVWVNRAWGGGRRPPKGQPAPEYLNWDLWLGPAPERPFHRVYWPGPKWYQFWDFGSGTMSDLGSHYNDLPFWALKVRQPRTIEPVEGPPPNGESAPKSMAVTYEYAERGDWPAVKVTWYQGEYKPKQWHEIPAVQKYRSGFLFVGDKGMIVASYGKHKLLPEAMFLDFAPPTPYIPRSIGHHAEWIHAAKTGAPTTCHFKYAGELTEANHLGNIAHRVARKIEWDPVGLKTRNSPEADKLISKEYRKGWEFPG